MSRALMEYSPETEAFDPVAMSPGELEEEGELFADVDEMELATGLLDVRGESELDRFLARLIAKAGQAGGQAMDAQTARALAAMLRGAAKRALPVIGQLPGNYLGGPAGADRSGRPADEAGHYFGLELEGLSAEDQEFEVARSFVRFAGDAAQHTAAAAQRAGSTQGAARTGVLQAARHHAPGLLRSLVRPRVTLREARLAPPAAGRWVRRGRHLIIVDC